MTKTKDKKPFLCRLGIHRHIWIDAAMFSSAAMCGKCYLPIYENEAADVKAERQAFQQLSPEDQEKLFTQFLSTRQTSSPFHPFES